MSFFRRVQFLGLFVLWTASSIAPLASALQAPDPSRRLTFGQLLATSLSLPQTKTPTLQSEQTTPFFVSAAAETTHESYLLPTLQKAFPHAMTYDSLVRRVAKILPPRPITSSSSSSSSSTRSYNTTAASSVLLATSFCCDEVNRGLERKLEAHYGDQFNLGGLCGIPFSGLTGFKAMQSHIPDNGSALIVYGPHVGIDANGVLGQISRRGQHGETACCGSAAAAAKYVRQQRHKKSLSSGVSKAKSAHGDVGQVILSSPLDMEQSQVNSLLLPYKDRLDAAPVPMLALPYILFEIQDTMLRQIVKEAGLDSQISLLGGIQINTPPGDSDYFCPLKFDSTIPRQGQRNQNHLKELYPLQ